jgi:hypothetical protein
MADLTWIEIVGRVLLASVIAITPGLTIWLSALGLYQVGCWLWRRRGIHQPAG